MMVLGQNLYVHTMIEYNAWALLQDSVEGCRNDSSKNDSSRMKALGTQCEKV